MIDFSIVYFHFRYKQQKNIVLIIVEEKRTSEAGLR